jgi:hypothetical protein
VDILLHYLQDPSNRFYAVRVREFSTPGPAGCRCGKRIAPGGTVVRVEDLPQPAAELFREQSFCSVRCLRAFCLESLETLNALDTPESGALVSDLHDLYLAMAAAFAQILAGPEQPGGGAGW